MNQKNDRRVQYTKMFLKEALLALMKEKHISKITPTELCRKADINRNTFYAHYTCPADLLREIEDELYNEIMGCVTLFSNNSLKLNDICRAIKEHADLCAVILSDRGDRDFLFRIIASAHDVTINEWKPLAPMATEKELESFFTYCANGSVAVIREWVNDGMKTPHEEIARILEIANSASLYALCSKKEEK